MEQVSRIGFIRKHLINIFGKKHNSIDFDFSSEEIRNKFTDKKTNIYVVSVVEVIPVNNIQTPIKQFTIISDSISSELSENSELERM